MGYYPYPLVSRISAINSILETRRFDSNETPNRLSDQKSHAKTLGIQVIGWTMDQTFPQKSPFLGDFWDPVKEPKTSGVWLVGPNTGPTNQVRLDIKVGFLFWFMIFIRFDRCFFSGMTNWINPSGQKLGLMELKFWARSLDQRHEYYH